MIIEPGIGLESIKYGIKEKELIVLLGSPDKVDETEYVEGSGDWNRILWYFSKNVGFTFDEEDNYRLSVITVIGPGYTLFKKDLFGSPINTVRAFISNKTEEIPQYKDHSFLENESHECLDHHGLGILFWFDSGNLSEMQCGILFESDGETIIWPD